MNRQETIKAFEELKAKHSFEVIMEGDSEGWSPASSWINWLGEMEKASLGEVRFVTADTSADGDTIVDVTINGKLKFIIKNPDDNFDESTIDEINIHLQTLGIQNKFRAIIPEGIQHFDDPCIFMTYVNDDVYEEIGKIGCGAASDLYHWEDGFVTWKGNSQ